MISQFKMSGAGGGGGAGGLNKEARLSKQDPM